MSKHFNDGLDRYEMNYSPLNPHTARAYGLPQDVRNVLEWLTDYYPTPVKVLFVKHSSGFHNGQELPYAWKDDDDHYEIHVQTHNNPGTRGDLVEAIIHEWAHVRNWVDDPDEYCHSDEWALDFVEMYREYLDHCGKDA